MPQWRTARERTGMGAPLRRYRKRVAEYEREYPTPEAAERAAVPPKSALTKIQDVVLAPSRFGAGLVSGGLPAAWKSATAEEPIQWGDVFRQWGFPETRLSDAMAGLYSETGKGWKPRRGGPFDPTVRGILGLGADIALDPLTYLVGPLGGAAGRVTVKLAPELALLRGGARTAKIPLSRAGVAKLGDLAAEEMPAAVRYARRLAGIPARLDELKPIQLSRAREAVLDLASKETAHQWASQRIARLIDEGAEELRSPTLIGWKPPFAKDTLTLLSREKFKPVGMKVSRTLRHLTHTPTGEVKPLAAEFLSGYRKLDSLVNELVAPLRGRPGVREAFSAMHAEVALGRHSATETVRELTRGWQGWVKDPVGYFSKKTGPHAGELPVFEYARLALENPERYPVSALPQVVIERLPDFRHLYDEIWMRESSRRLIGGQSYRKNYVPLMWRNTQEELRGLSPTMRLGGGGGFSTRLSLGPFKEERKFQTADEAFEFVKGLRDRGAVNWLPRFDLDLRSVTLKRLYAHAQATAFDNVQTRLLTEHGLDKELVWGEIFKRLVPEARELVAGRMAPLVRRIREKPQLQRRATGELVNIVRLIARGETGKGAKLTGLSDEARALYWMARIRGTKSLGELYRLRKRHAAEMDLVSPGAAESIRKLAGIHKSQFLASFNEPFKQVDVARWMAGKEGALPKGAVTGRRQKWITYLPESMADQVAQMRQTTLNEKQIGPLLRTYDWLQDHFKLGVTAFWPAFHIRNAYSNLAQNFVDMGLQALDPMRALRSAEIMAGKTGTLKTKTGKWTYDEIRTLAKELGVLSPSDVIYETMGGVRRRRIMDLPAARAARRTGTTIENSSKLASFTAWLERGLDPTEAAERVHRILFDYQALSNFERTTLKRMIPFYCVPEEAEILTRNGWRICDDLCVGEEVLTYNVLADRMEWNPLLDVAIFDHDQPLMTLDTKRGHRLRFTSEHRWPVSIPKQTVKGHQYCERRRMVRGAYLNTNHRLIMSAPYIAPEESLLTPESAGLLGWLLTDGYWRWRGNYLEAIIYQSPSKFLEEVRAVAAGAEGAPHPDTGCVAVAVTQEKLGPLRQLLGRKKSVDDWCDVVTRLSRPALEAMYDAMYKADGSTAVTTRGDYMAMQLEGVRRTFTVLALLLGKRTRLTPRGSYLGTQRYMRVVNSRLGSEWFRGRVWCPKTANGTWVMRQGGTIVLTGNTWTKKNIGAQARLLAQAPGRWASQLKLAPEDRGPSRELLPDYLQGRFKMRVESRGKLTYLTNIDLPVTSAIEQIFGAGDMYSMLRQNLGAVDPVLKIFTTLSTGAEVFTGRSLEERENLRAFGRVVKALPEPMQRFFEFEEQTNPYTREPEYTMNGLKAYLVFKAWAFARVYSTFRRLDEPLDSWALSFLTGTGLKEFDLSEKEERILRARMVRLERDLLKRGKLRSFEVTYAPRD